MVKNENADNTEQAFVEHANRCPLGCGIDYERGRCTTGDTLADAMTDGD